MSRDAAAKTGHGTATGAAVQARQNVADIQDVSKHESHMKEIASVHAEPQDKEQMPGLSKA